MASTLLSVFRNSSQTVGRLNKLSSCFFNIKNVRSIYAKSTLGLDTFEEHRVKTKSHMTSISEKFKEKMSEYAGEDSKNMIFTEDLKNMIHITDNDKDIDLVVRMLKRYNAQNKSLRFGNYVFGPVVMRMFYVHNKADLALECFKSEELSGIFDQYITYQILLDLLYENQKYDEVLEVTEIIKTKQFDGTKFPRNVVVLALAACYKLNSKESLEYTLKLWCELNNVGHLPMRRAATFASALALNQGKPEVALEIVSLCKNQNYTTVRNLKVAALCELGRFDDIITIIKTMLSNDAPKNSLQTFNRNVLDKVKSAVENLEDPEITLDFNRLYETLVKENHISDDTLDEQLCSEIQMPPKLPSGERYQSGSFQDRREGWNQRRPSRRPGLVDLI